MKKFLIKLACYLIIPLLSFILAIEVSINRHLNDNCYYKLDSCKNVLILGNSHSQCSLNDSIINQSINLSSSAESYFYTYYKLKKLVNSNPKIKLVILEYSDYIFSEIMDKWTYEEEYLGYNYPLYSQVLPFSEKCYLFAKNPQSFIIATKDAQIQKLAAFFSEKDELYNKLGWGNYKSLKYSRINELKKKINNIKPCSNNPSKNSSFHISYMDSMVNLCKTRNIELIFLRSPVHPDNEKNMISNEANLLDLFKKKYSDIILLDYSKQPFSDSEFADFEHLNYKGAIRFSKLINSFLQEKYKNSIDCKL